MKMVDKEQGLDGVSRARRYTYVRNTSWASIGAAVALTLLSASGFVKPDALMDVTVNGLITIATALSLSYVGGSVIDYNGGLRNTVLGRSPRQRDDDDGEAKG